MTSTRGALHGPTGGMKLPARDRDVVGWERWLLFSGGSTGPPASVHFADSVCGAQALLRAAG